MLHFQDGGALGMHHGQRGGATRFVIWHATIEDDVGFPAEEHLDT